MFAEERQEKIIEIVNTKGKIVVPVLCETFGVSASTIRNDLRQLEEAKLITRTHGGAIRNTKAGREQLPTDKESRMAVQKKAIARAALEFVDDGDIIAVTAGSTTFELLKLLTVKNNLTIIVNDIKNALWLEENTNFNIYVLGGLIRRGYHYVTLPESNELLKKINIDKAFFSCNGYSLQRGATAPDFETAKNVRDIFTACCEAYLLADSSKIGTVNFAKIADLREVKAIIVDSDIEREDYDEMKSATEIIVAER